MCTTVDGQFLDPDCESNEEQRIEKHKKEYNSYSSTDDDDDDDANRDWEDETGLTNQF